MARRVRNFDWSSTPLGAIRNWQQSLVTAVDILLASGHAMQLAWGPQQIVFYNDAYAPMLGDRHPSALGLPFCQAWPDIWEEIEPLVQRVFAGETVRFEDMPLVMTRNGYPEDTWWTFSYSPVRDDSGEIAGLLNVTMDSSPKMRAENAERERDEMNVRLRANEQRLQALVSASSDVVYTMSPDCMEMRQFSGRGFFTDGAAQSFKWMDEYLFAEDRVPVLAVIQKSIASKGTFELEYRVRRADGTAGWTFSRAIPILGHDGNIIQWFGMAADVTERRRSEERQAFLLKLGDELRPLNSPSEIKTRASYVLGQQLGVNRAFYAEVEGEDWIVEGGFASGVNPLAAGRYAAETYGQRVMDTYRAARRIVFYDTRTDPGFSAEEREAHREIEIIGAIGIPLIKAGKLTAILTVHTATPRNWTEDEIALVEETAERTWEAVERAHTETALRKREDQFRLLFESIDEGVFIAEPSTRLDGLRDWRYVAMNERSHAMFGRPDLTGQSMRDNFPAEDEDWYDIYETVFQNGKGHRFERGVLSQGVVLELFVTRIETTAHAQQLMVVMLDVTQRRRAMDGLRESEERQAFLLKLNDSLHPLTDTIEIKGLATHLLREQMGVGWCFYNGFDDTGRIAETLQGSVQEGLPQTDSLQTIIDIPEIASLLSSGNVVNLSDTAAFPLSDHPSLRFYARLGVQAVLCVPLLKGSQVIAVLGVAHSERRTWSHSDSALLADVADRTWVAIKRAQAEALLRESEQKYRTLFNSMEEGFCALDVVFNQLHQPVDLRFVEVNPAFERNSGILHAKGRRVSEVVPGLEAQWFEIYGQVAMTGEPRRFENEAKPLGRWFEVNTFRVDPPDRHRVAVLFSDVTERRHREEELKRTNRDLEQFAYSASHDLQEPIRTVSIYAELLETRAANQMSSEMLEWLQLVRTGARRMERLVRDLLLYSQITAMDSTPVEIDADEPLQAALLNLEGAIRESGARIIAVPLPRVMIHSIYLQQLFQNLIGNAIKYRSAERRPKVNIQAERDNHGWRFSVADNGIGIESKYVEFIFGIFKRLHNENKYPGTGIGLAICQRIVERIGGRIWVQSELGKGSIFHFWIPN
jgi:PAS domain S-box-containing protein